jgi:hypothetical protein
MRRALRALLLESLVVVMSILLAFWLDAWWDGRKVAVQVDEELRNIEREINDNTNQLNGQVQIMRRIVSATDALLAEMDGRPDRQVLMVTDTLAWLALVGPSPTWNASLGGIKTLIAAGHLSDIHSLLLRARLAGLESRIDDPVEDQLFALHVRDDQLYPLLDPTFDRRSVAAVGVDFFKPGGTAKALLGGRRVPTPNRLAIKNVLRTRRQYFSIAIYEMEALHSDFQALQALIEEELGGS